MDNFADLAGRIHQSFAELNSPVSQYSERMQKIYMKRYAKPIYLGGGRVKEINTHDLPIDNWALFGKEHLLNDNMSKFWSLAKPKEGRTLKRFIEIVLNKPAQVCAIGLRSANDFPHLDPSVVSISVTKVSS